MSPTYLWLALVIVLFDLVALITNLGKLTYHAHWSATRLIIGAILSLALLALIISIQQRRDVVQLIILGTFLLTVITWMLIRKGVGQKYVLLSLSTNGLKDWRAIRDFRITKLSEQTSQLVLIDFTQREYKLTINQSEATLTDFVQQHLPKTDLQ
ncbi:hypothetical protein [Lapidilactobacillus wuchangensis]|uniref:hypothetical protein n=1 Tax=Lapidilactobacillus wuchangensis TaxID=2486001 RepID=UPI000F7681D0|nr:hypothetical protein [Lapidilactobacillus wuchangensis]